MVVATKQDVGAHPRSVQVIRRHTLSEAIGDFDLAWSDVALEPLPRGAARERIDALEHARVDRYTRDEWLHEARCASVLAAHPNIPASDRVKAAMYSALFHLHAGHVAQAKAMIDAVDPTIDGKIPGELRVWLELIRATYAIDHGDFDGALAWGAAAVESAEGLSETSREEVLGRALGTLGRAYVHAGGAREGVPFLERAVAHHRMFEPTTLARSLIYLATAQRRSGDVSRALATIEQARADLANPRLAGESETASSRLFADYELGRILYAMDELAAAEVALRRVRDSQPSPTDYPRLGALRYLAAIALRTNETVGCELLHEAIEAANSLDPSSALHAVAAAACGEALRRPESLDDVLRRDASETWASHQRRHSSRTALDDIVY